MWMVVGLGNPGQEHEGTRHNVGFTVLDRLSDRAGARLSDKKFRARMGRGRLEGQDVILLAPLTFMNNSGESVGPALGFFKMTTDRLLVIHDELELPFGEVNLKVGGGHGGHNGLRSLKRHLPNDAFGRIRFGIGRPPPQWDAAGYVLGRFSRAEKESLDAPINAAVDAVEAVIRKGLLEASPRRPANQSRRASGR